MTAHDPRPAPVDAAPPPPARGPVSSRLTTRRKFLFAAVATLLGLFVIAGALEVTLRLRRGRLLDFRTLLPPRYQWLRDMPCDYDPTLGFLPRPGVWRWGGDDWTANVGSDRLRVTPPLSPPPEPGDRPVLLVGDSFTFGDEVNDDQTWAAHLQSRLGSTVLNAGVFAYGVDQAVLRAEALIPLYKPKLVVLSFIGDDIVRAENSYFCARKPWFDLTSNGQLTLHNVPVSRDPPLEPPLPALRDALGHSHLADAVLRRAAPDWWGFRTRKREHDRGVPVTAALARRLDDLARRHDARLVVIGFGHRLPTDNARASDALDHIRPSGIPVIDLVTGLDDALRNDPALAQTFFARGGHYSPTGNQWIADRIASAITELTTSPERGAVTSSDHLHK